MHRHQRLNTLLEMLGQRGRIEVDEAAEELKVSLATIRRDLDHLAERQLLTRTRGGAVTGNVAYDLPGRHKAQHAREKERIGATAARFVQRGMVIGLNGGTTTREVSRAIATRPEFNDSGATHALTVVTNALNIAHELTVRQNIKIVATGGVARPHSFELTGPYAAATLNEISLDIAFISVDAIDPLRGAYSDHEAEANVNRLLVSRARQVVVVADASKLGGYAFARICATLDLDMLITSVNADPDLVAAFEMEGVKVRAV
ncbi:MAG TPA: DeoR/GlpR family DNA-binding transcription regulator [Amycolatopsis sp.]|uniref:DeoR/GlpR family DNA-binding transcription regulator n=1 Tax=Amycolatopsis sp. TaxID=37632 RepID=UPI002B4858E8|nr:DeoR/GlpR family DNA-binding transcription regulator [Amycolatopsis sp.]HKS43569.1 DeoR/GlpR family DNA-binding transcription regulator [Amycolatopsis sp.]